MTEKQLRQNTVAIFEAWAGLKESDGSHMQIINIYNSYNPLPRGYKLKPTDPWCAGALSGVAIKAGLTDIIPVECGCGEQIKLFQQMGRWQEADDYVPQMGDVIYYDWDDTGAGDNTGWPDHVGMVVSVSGSTIKVIEGNKSDAVGYREIAVNARYIRGYGLPDYASKATADTETAGTYTVAQGDTLWALAERYLGSGSRYTEIMSLNGLTSDTIVVGQTLKIPGLGGEAEAPATPQAPASNVPSYKVGTTYTLQVDELSVRTGAGTNYSRKSYSQLTENAKKNAYSSGHLKKGTRVTCQEVRTVGKDIWMRIPSGWVAAYFNGKIYIA